MPLMGPYSYQTYAIRAPLQTHTRSATCEEVDCKYWRDGWTFRWLDLTEQEQYLVTHTRRRYRVIDFNGEKYLAFDPGQPCFNSGSHRLSLDRPLFYYTGQGDRRVFTTRKAEKLKPDSWRDRFGEQLTNLRDEINKG